ncbi:sulfate ABC transporter, permease protein [Escherichia coli]|uniref:Sulfate ABC transporter, permease protein n=1 Tax=Escherichia coli TaxID=562 RepID=A0A377D1W7_ECOLX|nr:sulfate ABC transporter, permease protein [Escherichia coli]
MAEVTQLKRYDARPINWGKWFLIGIGMLVSAFILLVPMILYLRTGVQQRADAGFTESGPIRTCCTPSG